jgi:membrane protein YdbS with pleckstrin-like domain
MDFFSNETVELSSLPRAEEITLQPIEQSYWKVLQWGWMIVWGIILLALTLTIIFTRQKDLLLWVLIVTPLLILCLFGYWLMRKSFSRKAYALRDRDIIYRSGWLIQQLSVCPFNRIQHCSINAGPFERKLGLASLSVYTAGTEGADIKIPGLKQETAHALRDFIMKKTTANEQAVI